MNSSCCQRINNCCHRLQIAKQLAYELEADRAHQPETESALAFRTCDTLRKLVDTYEFRSTQADKFNKVQTCSSVFVTRLWVYNSVWKGCAVQQHPGVRIVSCLMQEAQDAVNILLSFHNIGSQTRWPASYHGQKSSIKYLTEENEQLRHMLAVTKSSIFYQVTFLVVHNSKACQSKHVLKKVTPAGPVPSISWKHLKL